MPQDLNHSSTLKMICDQWNTKNIKVKGQLRVNNSNNDFPFYLLLSQDLHQTDQCFEHLDPRPLGRVSADNPASTRQQLYQGYQPDGVHQSLLPRFLDEHRPGYIPRKTGSQGSIINDVTQMFFRPPSFTHLCLASSDFKNMFIGICCWALL